MEEQLKEILAESPEVTPDEIDYDTRLIADLGLTSFDFADIAARAEEEFNISIQMRLSPALRRFATCSAWYRRDTSNVSDAAARSGSPRRHL